MTGGNEQIGDGACYAQRVSILVFVIIYTLRKKGNYEGAIIKIKN